MEIPEITLPLLRGLTTEFYFTPYASNFLTQLSIDEILLYGEIVYDKITQQPIFIVVDCNIEEQSYYKRYRYLQSTIERLNSDIPLVLTTLYNTQNDAIQHVKDLEYTISVQDANMKPEGSKYILLQDTVHIHSYTIHSVLCIPPQGAVVSFRFSLMPYINLYVENGLLHTTDDSIGQQRIGADEGAVSSLLYYPDTDEWLQIKNDQMLNSTMGLFRYLERRIDNISLEDFLNAQLVQNTQETSTAYIQLREQSPSPERTYIPRYEEKRDEPIDNDIERFIARGQLKELISYLNTNVMDVHADDEYIFRMACHYKQPAIMKYLLYTIGDVNIFAHNNQVFWSTSPDVLRIVLGAYQKIDATFTTRLDLLDDDQLYPVAQIILEYLENVRESLVRDYYLSLPYEQIYEYVLEKIPNIEGLSKRHIYNLFASLMESSGLVKECPICMSEQNIHSKCKRCGNSICIQCRASLQIDKCPYCRTMW